MNITNGSAKFFSEIEATAAWILIFYLVSMWFSRSKVSLGTPGRKQVLVVCSSIWHRDALLMMKEH